ncbi:MAG: insulinase family protein [Cytophagales bacterium]|nr:insulinase family protein [Cytophagales bacterium]MDW8383705.1 pitrilysin family protein [Flammeovirgaceae bacterium]
MKEYELYTFPNGIRFIHKQVKYTKIAHCCIMADIGSRDEQPHQVGIAHFWEHLAFKGTQKRKSYHILNAIDGLGGELNAFTTKEKICFHVSVLDSHFDKAADILSDITFHSTFPQKEIEKERNVILEEMHSYENDLSDSIADDFDNLIFQSHPLGNNILGTVESVSRFQKSDFDEFIEQNLDTSRLVFASISSLSFQKAFRIARKYLEPIPLKQSFRKRVAFSGYKPVHQTKNKGQNQVHCAIGTTCYSLFDSKRIPFFLLANLLGGPASNSRLNMAIREKHGFVYSIEASTSFFSDVGEFAIFYATEPSKHERCYELVMRELQKLRQSKLSTLQLHKAKQQLMGQMAMSEESNQSLMLLFAKSILDFGYVPTLNDIFRQIEQITPEILQEVANEIFSESRLSTLVYFSAK